MSYVQANPMPFTILAFPVESLGLTVIPTELRKAVFVRKWQQCSGVRGHRPSCNLASLCRPRVATGFGTIEVISMFISKVCCTLSFPPLQMLWLRYPSKPKRENWSGGHRSCLPGTSNNCLPQTDIAVDLSLKVLRSRFFFKPRLLHSSYWRCAKQRNRYNLQALSLGCCNVFKARVLWAVHYVWRPLGKSACFS